MGEEGEECDAWCLGAGGSEQQDFVFLSFLFFVISCEIKRASSADKTIENTVGGDAGGARKSLLARNTNGRWEQVWTRVTPAPP